MTDPTEHGSPDVGIGVVPILNRAAGGTHQYSLSLIEALMHVRPAPPPVILAADSSDWSMLAPLLTSGRFVSLEPPSLRRRLRGVAAWTRRRLRRVAAWTLGADKVERVATRFRRLRSGSESNAARAQHGSFASAGIAPWLKSNGVDLVILPWPEPRVIYSGIPYLLAVHDLQHRLQPEFPEVSADGEAERRERLFQNGIERALLVLVDSEVGQEDLLTQYSGVIEPDRVKLLPFLPAPYLDPVVSDDAVAEVRIRHRLPSRYLFFPAQFWSHKNHVRVVEAIGRLRADRGLEVPVVMCGSAEGELRKAVLSDVQVRASAAGISNLIRNLGYVPDADMGPLYRASAGVLLPTFFGPTNIPVLEGWSMGVPVLSSDIRGIREQCGDAAVLVDPRSAESIAAGIASLWLDEALRARLVTAGRARLESYGPEGYRRRLAEILDEADARLRESGGLRG